MKRTKARYLIRNAKQVLREAALKRKNKELETKTKELETKLNDEIKKNVEETMENIIDSIDHSVNEFDRLYEQTSSLCRTKTSRSIKRSLKYHFPFIEEMIIIKFSHLFFFRILKLIFGNGR